MISQYFTRRSMRSPIVLNCLRCRFARFKLCAHLLDLRCLFVEPRSKLRHGCTETLL